MGDSRSELIRALGGDRAAMRGLLDRLAPVIWSRVARVAERGHRTHEEARQLAEDLSQEVFASLFQSDARALREWAPARGLSLESYVGLLAEHQAIAILRSGRRSAWREDATEERALEGAAGATEGVDARLQARDTLVHVLERVRHELSPRGLQLLELLVVEERSVEDVCAALAMTEAAVYAWRSRIGKLVARIAREVEDEATAVAGSARAAGASAGGAS